MNRGSGEREWKNQEDGRRQGKDERDRREESKEDEGAIEALAGKASESSVFLGGGTGRRSSPPDKLQEVPDGWPEDVAPMDGRTATGGEEGTSKAAICGRCAKRRRMERSSRAACRRAGGLGWTTPGAAGRNRSKACKATLITPTSSLPHLASLPFHATPLSLRIYVRLRPQFLPSYPLPSLSFILQDLSSLTPLASLLLLLILPPPSFLVFHLPPSLIYPSSLLPLLLPYPSRPSPLPPPSLLLPAAGKAQKRRSIK